MFVTVQLLKGYSKPLLYQVPHNLCSAMDVGSIVCVPIRNQTATAVVLATTEQPPTDVSFTIKQIKSVEPLPKDTHYQTFINHLSYYYQTKPIHFIKRIRHFITQQKRKARTPQEQPVLRQPKIITLTDEQQAVYDFVQPKIEQGLYTPTLVHGITGSGKTEVYKKLIAYAAKQNKTTLLLLPEVTLAIQFQKLLEQQLPQHVVFYRSEIRFLVLAAHRQNAWLTEKNANPLF